MSGPIIQLDFARSQGLRRFSEPGATDRTQARAGLMALFATRVGGSVARADLTEALRARDDTSAATVAQVLTAAGQPACAVTVAQPDASHWPALAEMTSGQLLLVLAQEGDHLVIHDPTCADHRAEVPVTEFLPYFSGTLIRPQQSMDQLTQKHGAAPRKTHWFWSEFAGFRRQIAEVAVGSFVANLLAVAVALFSLQVYDRVIPHQSTATLWVLASGAMLAMLFEAALRIARARLVDGAGRLIELKVQALLMDRVLGMKRGTPGQTPSGLFSAVREFGAVREFFTATTLGTLTDLPFVLLFLAIVASIGGNVVWVLVAGAVLMVLPSFFLQGRMIRLTQDTQGANTKSNKLLHEVIYEADTIKAHRGEERFRQMWRELTTVASYATSEQRRLASTLTYWAQGVSQATYVAAIVTGTFLVFSGSYTVGTIIAVGILTSRSLAPLTQLAATLARWSNVKAALEALDQVAEAPQQYDDSRSYLRRERLDGAFELRGVGFAYEPDAGQTLDIPALRIAAGSRVAVLGPNGSGKSTLLKLLSGLYGAQQGQVMVDGVEMGQIMPRDLRRGIGYLSQEVRLFSGTLRENLNLTLLEQDDARMLAALDFAGLGEHVRRHPRGLDLEISDGGEGLSIGQRQSIGWARLWLQDPRVVLLDEPTAAMDQALETALVGRLGGWLAGRTAVIATHRKPILELTERTLVLAQGRMVADGPRAEVMAHLAGTRVA